MKHSSKLAGRHLKLQAYISKAITRPSRKHCKVVILRKGNSFHGGRRKCQLWGCSGQGGGEVRAPVHLAQAASLASCTVVHLFIMLSLFPHLE